MEIDVATMMKLWPLAMGILALAGFLVEARLRIKMLMVLQSPEEVETRINTRSTIKYVKKKQEETITDYQKHKEDQVKTTQRIHDQVEKGDAELHVRIDELNKNLQHFEVRMAKAGVNGSK